MIPSMPPLPLTSEHVLCLLAVHQVESELLLTLTFEEYTENPCWICDIRFVAELFAFITCNFYS